MSEDSNDKNLTKPSGGVPTQINLGPKDLSWLPENERNALWIDYEKSMMDIDKKERELHVDVDILKKTLDKLSDTTREVSDSGNAITITHSQTTAVGRTEVMMGNTEQAQSGKLSKSQTGEKDWTPYYIFGGILALIIIAALMKG